MTKQIAHTNLDPVYPGYINATVVGDGTVKVTVRGDPKTRNGVFVCGYSRDRGQPGRCTPGDANCNNYCNLAPDKGPMQARPAPSMMVDVGETVTLTITEAAWAQLLKRATGDAE